MQRPDAVAVTRWIWLSAAGLGLVFGVAIVLTPSTCRSAPLWVVWASLAVALTCAAGAVFGYGVARGLAFLPCVRSVCRTCLSRSQA